MVVFTGKDHAGLWILRLRSSIVVSFIRKFLLDAEVLMAEKPTNGGCEEPPPIERPKEELLSLRKKDIYDHHHLAEIKAPF